MRIPEDKDLILVGYRGSHSHNLVDESTDDVDLIQIAIPPLSHYFGLDHFEVIDHGIDDLGYDIVCYEFLKFVRMLVKGNPNVVSFLWGDPDMYIKCTPAGRVLLENKRVFNAKTPIYKATIGYAKSQLHKMNKPTTNAYKQSKRLTKFEEHGYDTKNAMTLIRVLRMSIEYFDNGVWSPFRVSDRDYLLRIKHGTYTKGAIEQEAGVLISMLEDSYHESSLPDFPDMQAINKLTINILKNYFDGEFK